MNEYEMILETLQYQVDNGYITIEEAEAVNEIAYDRYVEESAYTRVLSKKIAQYDVKESKLKELGEYLDTLKNNVKNPKLSETARQNMIVKIKKTENEYNRLMGKLYNGSESKLANLKSNLATAKSGKDTNAGRVAKRSLNEDKKEWMKAHGNTGVAPEDKYKPNTYLDAQNAKRKLK